MLCIVLFILTVSKGCHGDANSTTFKEGLVRAPVVPAVAAAAARRSAVAVPAVAAVAAAAARRSAAAVPAVAAAAARRSAAAGDLLATLRRQLMRDNYDYQTGAAHSDLDRARPPQKGGVHVLRTREQSQETQSQARQSYGAGTGVQRNAHKKRNERVHSYMTEAQYTQERRPKRILNSDQDPGQDPGQEPEQESRQDTGQESEQEPEQDSEQGSDQGPGQYPKQYSDQDPGQDHGQYRKPGRGQHSGRSLGKYSGQESDLPPGLDPAETHYLQHSNYDEMRDALGPNFSPDRRESNQKVDAYEPTYDNKKRGDYRPGRARHQQAVQVAPVTALRKYKQQRAQDMDERASGQLDAEDVQDLQDIADIEAKLRDEQDADYEAHTRRSRHKPSPPNKPPTPRDHNISKRDLLYYMDENRLRRRNYVSGEMTLTDTDDDDSGAEHAAPRTNQSPAPPPSELSAPPPTPPPTPPPDEPTPPVPDLSPADHTPNLPRGRVVTVSAGNVTYKLLTMRARAGRRSGARRFLEERAPEGVALISLDHAPLAGLRLPRARRQYMHGA